MYAGHVAWITPLVLVGVFLVRSLVSPSRRQGRPRGPGQHGPASPFLDRSGPPAGRGGPDAGVPVGSGMAPGWFRDPFVRHEQRFWSGTAWTEHVTDDGVPALDPPPTPAGGADGGDTSPGV